MGVKANSSGGQCQEAEETSRASKRPQARTDGEHWLSLKGGPSGLCESSRDDGTGGWETWGSGVKGLQLGGSRKGFIFTPETKPTGNLPSGPVT